MNNAQAVEMPDLTPWGPKFETEIIETFDGKTIEVVFIEHASLAFMWDGYTVYVDPVGQYADYSKLPKADLILVTHEHADHFDPEALRVLSKKSTVVIGSPNVAAKAEGIETFPHFEPREVAPSVIVETVPAYNVSPNQLKFHPKERGDNGYLLTLGQTRIYIAGDTEPIPEMSQLGKVDIMFLPVNQPYTMTPKQAAEAARTIGAPIFFPYHTTDTDMEKLKKEMADTPDISLRIHHMP